MDACSPLVSVNKVDCRAECLNERELDSMTNLFDNRDIDVDEISNAVCTEAKV